MSNEALEITGNMFTCTNLKCECDINLNHGANGKKHSYWVKALEGGYNLFAFAPKDGLVMHYSKTNSKIIRNKILEDFLNVDLFQPDKIKDIIIQYGFLANLSENEEITVEHEDIAILLYRYRTLAELMSEIEKREVDYNSVFHLFCILLFGRPCSMVYSPNRDGIQSCLHPFSQLWFDRVNSVEIDYIEGWIENFPYDITNLLNDKFTGKVKEFDYKINNDVIDNMNTLSYGVSNPVNDIVINKEEEVYCMVKNMDTGEMEKMPCGSFKPVNYVPGNEMTISHITTSKNVGNIENLLFGSSHTVNDTFLENEMKNDNITISKDTGKTGYDFAKYNDSQKYVFGMKVTYLYLNMKIDAFPVVQTARNVINFFYDLTQEMTIVENEQKYGEVISERNITDLPKFRRLFKEKLIVLAKQTVKEEFDYALSSIHPVYNIETMSPEWEIPDLFTALYFALFYKRSDTIYRRCFNPNCNRLFEVKTTNNKKLYHAKSCQNAAAQMYYRRRIKEVNEAE